jgi:hypothetical protein
MIGLLRTYFDGIAEREAEKLLEADLPIMRRWKRGVTHRISRRKATVAMRALRRKELARSYA